MASSLDLHQEESKQQGVFTSMRRARMMLGIMEAQEAYTHARAYEHAMVYVHGRTSVSLLVKGSGLLALLLSSVILLGGFVESLGTKDFLCITAITAIQSIGIFNDWENNLAYHVEFLFPVLEMFKPMLGNPSPMSFLMILVAYPAMSLILCIQLIYLLGPFVCAAISSWRISKINHSNRDGTDGMANMMVALNLFYSLVIFQGSVFGVLFLNALIGDDVMARHLLAQEQLLEERGNKQAINKYLYDISVKCRQDPLSIRGMDLIKYAVELLDSESQVDYLYGARLLSAFVKKKQGEAVRSLLLPSTPRIQKLIESLSISSSLDEACVEFRSRNRCLAVMSRIDDQREIRELAATIVAELAGHIDLAKYPESMRYISSLLQEETTQTYWNIKQVPNTQGPIGPLTKEEQWRQDFEEMPQRPIGPLTISEQRRHDIKELRKARKMREREKEQQKLMEREERRQWKLMMEQKRLMIRKERRPQNNNGDGSYELIVQGLTILDRLASNNNNCSFICSAPGLLPKITAPVYSGTLLLDVTVKAWSDIVTRSLKLLHKLIRAPGSISRSLRQDISSNGQAMSNLKGILNLSSEAGQELQLPAMEILTELALDSSPEVDRETKEILITKQCEVFLDNGEGGESAIIAGRALVLLCENNSDLIMNTREDITDRLTELLDAKNSITHRIIAAEIMENLCTHSDVDKQFIKEILLPKVLKEIISFRREPQQRNTSAGQNNSASGDEENQRDSESRKVTSWIPKILVTIMFGLQENSSTACQNKLSDQESEIQEPFLSLTLAICNKLNSADDFDDTIDNTIGREAFVDELKSIISDNCEATPESLRTVKLCGWIAKSMMQCHQYQEYAEHFRNKGFESLLSEASETMSRLESCMLFHGTDFGIKKTVSRPLISEIQLQTTP